MPLATLLGWKDLIDEVGRGENTGSTHPAKKYEPNRTLTFQAELRDYQMEGFSYSPYHSGSLQT